VKPARAFTGKELNEAERREDAKYQDDIKLDSAEFKVLKSDRDRKSKLITFCPGEVNDLFRIPSLAASLLRGARARARIPDLLSINFYFYRSRSELRRRSKRLSGTREFSNPSWRRS